MIGFPSGLSCPIGISRLVPQGQRPFFGVLSQIENGFGTAVRQNGTDVDENLEAGAGALIFL